MTPAQREALGQTAYAAYYRSSLAGIPVNPPVAWDASLEETREAWRCAAEAAATTYASEMLPAEPPVLSFSEVSAELESKQGMRTEPATRPDLPRRLTPPPGSILAAVTGALEGGRKPA